MAHQEWTDADRWLSRQRPTHRLAYLVNDVRQVFRQISWNISLHGAAAAMRTGDTVCLLSDHLLPTTIIDSFMELIITRVAQTPSLSERVYIGNLTFAEELRKLDNLKDRNTYSAADFPLLHSLGVRIQSGSVDDSFLPFNINGNHWAIFDLKTETISLHYGDSLNGKQPLGPVVMMRKWLSHHGIATLRQGGDLKHGTQLDEFSCGLVVPNTIEHPLFGDELWIELDKDYICMQCFIQLIKSHNLSQKSQLPHLSTPAEILPILPRSTKIKLDLRAQPAEKSSGLWNYFRTCLSEQREAETKAWDELVAERQAALVEKDIF